MELTKALNNKQKPFTTTYNKNVLGLDEFFAQAISLKPHKFFGKENSPMIFTEAKTI